jgi:lipid-binding SYLF domain-containing protein
MKTARRLVVASLFALSLGATQVRADPPETVTLEKAIEVLRANAAIPLKAISPAVLREAKGVAIIPHVLKAGLLFDHEFGHGVMVLRSPDGSWSDPIFVTIEGGGVGVEVGVESTDLVLVFKSPSSLERVLKGKGKLTLGTDASVAAGPLGRDAEVATDKLLRADVYSYSRSRGLFAGVALAGARLEVDGHANEAFYKVRGIQPQDVMTRRFAMMPAVETLKAELNRLSGQAPVVVPLVPVPPPVIGVPH